MVVTANLGDNIDYHQHKRENLGDLIVETLEAFEVHGGEDGEYDYYYYYYYYSDIMTCISGTDDYNV